MRWIDRQGDFDEMIRIISDAPAIAVDTEADSLHSYFDKVCLIQITAAGEDYVIDPLSGLNLASLGALLGSEEKTKILHGADYDLRILQRDFGYFIHSLVDTMICAQLLGYEAVGLAALLQRHFGLDVDKSHQRADWSMRPLPPDMLRYAALDTHYLQELASRLRAELTALGRWGWAEEEFRRLESIRFEANEPDPEAFRKLKGSNKLEPRGLAALSLLHQWRDRSARKLDRPPFKVMSNEALLDIATRLPDDREELSKIRGVSNFHLSRYLNEILGAVRSAKSMAESELPQKVQPKAWIRDRDLDRRIEKLKKVRDSISADLKIESSILAPRHVLSAVATIVPEKIEQLADIPAMREWQRALLGDAFIESMKR